MLEFYFDVLLPALGSDKDDRVELISMLGLDSSLLTSSTSSNSRILGSVKAPRSVPDAATFVTIVVIDTAMLQNNSRNVGA
jgi:hypothetical protein